MSRPAEPIIEEPLDSPLDPNLTKTEKKQERIKSTIEELAEPREDTIRLNDDIQQREEIVPLPAFVEGEATMNIR